MSEQGGQAQRSGQGARAQTSGVADAAVGLILTAAVLVHPTQLTVPLVEWARAAGRILSPLRAVTDRLPAANVTASDVLFLIAFVVWLLLRWRQRQLGEHVRRYPLALVGLFACACLSLVPFLKSWAPPIQYGRAAKQLIQLLLLFVCAYVPLVDYLGSERWRRKLVAAFFAAVACALLVGLAEYVRLRPPSPEARQAGAIISPTQVDATFGYQGRPAGAGERVGTASNRNVLGAWLTLVLPLLWAAFLFGSEPPWRTAALALAAGGALLLLHGGLWVAALVAMLGLSFARSRRAFAVTAAGMFVFYALAFSLGPQRHGQILLDSLMLHRSEDRFRTLPLYEIDEELDRSGRGAVLDRPPYSPWEQKYIEWQPALVALAHNPAFGVGLGNYQPRIGGFYSAADLSAYRMPKPSANLMEPGGNPFYAVWLAETGLVGLLAFTWLAFVFLSRAARGARAEADRLMKGLKLGSCAALGAACFGCLFTDYWVRGVGGAFAFVLALASASPQSQGGEGGAGADADQVPS